MDFANAKAIPLNLIVEHLGGKYSHTDAHGDLWYHSVFRPEEKTASFKINPKLNKWYDFGLTIIVSKNVLSKNQSGGDVIDLWNDFKNRDRKTGIPETLKDLGQFSHTPVTKFQNNRTEIIPSELKAPRYKILKIQDNIAHQGLKNELYRRRISQKIAYLYLKQGFIKDTVTGKTYTGFLFENDKGGYEVSIPNPVRGECFKTCIGPKSSTSIKPIKDFNSADIFEGFWDFLSWLEIKKIELPVNYSYILNSVSFTTEVSQKIMNSIIHINSIFLFMDNDAAGEAATHELAILFEKEEMQVGDMREYYKNQKDLNEYWSADKKPLPLLFRS